jgi:hypothetical protein
LLQASGEPIASGGTVAVFLGGLRQQLHTHAFQLPLHLEVVGKVHLLELVDETDETVEGLLMPLVSPVRMLVSISSQSTAV